MVTGNGIVMIEIHEAAFPRLSHNELECLRTMAQLHTYADGDLLFQAGQAEIDLHVVESGTIEILNPVDGDRVVATHGPGQFAGDIDLITGRPVIVTARAVAEFTVEAGRRPTGDLREHHGGHQAEATDQVGSRRPTTWSVFVCRSLHLSPQSEHGVFSDHAPRG
jgi:CRP-like cAMP-binding protein